MEPWSARGLYLLFTYLQSSTLTKKKREPIFPTLLFLLPLPSYLGMVLLIAFPALVAASLVLQGGALTVFDGPGLWVVVFLLPHPTCKPRCCCLEPRHHHSPCPLTLLVTPLCLPLPLLEGSYSIADRLPLHAGPLWPCGASNHSYIDTS